MSKSNPDSKSSSMAFVINILDGAGREFYLGEKGSSVALDAPQTPDSEQPLIVKTNRQIEKQVEILRKQYPPTCSVYAVERKEFEERWQSLSKPEPD